MQKCSSQKWLNRKSSQTCGCAVYPYTKFFAQKLLIACNVSQIFDCFYKEETTSEVDEENDSESELCTPCTTMKMSFDKQGFIVQPTVTLNDSIILGSSYTFNLFVREFGYQVEIMGTFCVRFSSSFSRAFLLALAKHSH